MASRSFSKTLRAGARQLAAPRVQQRTFVAARQLVRAAAVARPALAGAAQQTRGLKSMDFAGHKEDVYGKSDRRIGCGVRLDGSDGSV